MSYRETTKAPPVVEVMGPEVHTIFRRVNGQLYQMSEHRDIKKARAALKECRDEEPDAQFTMVSEDRPDLAPNTPLKKLQPAGWKL